MKTTDQKKNAEAHEFIVRNPCATLATAMEGKTADLAHVFVYLDFGFKAHFLSKIETRKIKNLQKNPHVNLLFSDKGSLEQVEFSGNARVVDDPEEILNILPKIQDVVADARSDYWSPPLSQVPGNGYCVVEITPMSIVYRNYKREEKDTGPHEHRVTLT